MTIGRYSSSSVFRIDAAARHLCFVTKKQTWVVQPVPRSYYGLRHLTTNSSMIQPKPTAGGKDKLSPFIHPYGSGCLVHNNPWLSYYCSFSTTTTSTTTSASSFSSETITPSSSSVEPEASSSTPSDTVVSSHDTSWKEQTESLLAKCINNSPEHLVDIETQAKMEEAFKVWALQEQVTDTSLTYVYQLFQALPPPRQKDASLLVLLLDQWRLGLQQANINIGNVSDLWKLLLEGEPDDTVFVPFLLGLAALPPHPEITIRTILQAYLQRSDGTNVKVWNAALEAQQQLHVRKYQPQPSEPAEAYKALLDWMCQTCTPNGSTYTILLQGLAAEPSPGAYQQARALWKDMEDRGIPAEAECYVSMMQLSEPVDEVFSVWEQVPPDRQTPDILTAMLSRLAKENDVSSIIKVWKEWQMQRKGEDDDNHNLSSILTTVLGIFVKNRHLLAAEELLKCVYEEELCQLDTVSINTVMNAWAKSDNPDAIQRIEALLDKYSEYAHVSFYHTLLKAWARSNQPQRIQQCQQILQDMMLEEPPIEVDSKSVTMVMNACARSKAPDAIEVIEALLDEYSEHASLHSYSALLNALARSNRPQKAEQCQEILQKMMDQQPPIHPDIVAVNTVMNAWAESEAPDAIEHIEALIEKYSEHVNVRSYNTLLKAWARSDRPQKGQQCQHILQDIMWKHPSLRPDMISYRTIFTSRFQSTDESAPEALEAVYNDLLNRQSKYLDLQPTPEVFLVSLIKCWKQSPYPAERISDKVEGFVNSWVSQGNEVTDKIAHAMQTFD